MLSFLVVLTRQLSFIEVSPLVCCVAQDPAVGEAAVSVSMPQESENSATEDMCSAVPQIQDSGDVTDNVENSSAKAGLGTNGSSNGFEGDQSVESNSGTAEEVRGGAANVTASTGEATKSEEVGGGQPEDKASAPAPPAATSTTAAATGRANRKRGWDQLGMGVSIRVDLYLNHLPTHAVF